MVCFDFDIVDVVVKRVRPYITSFETIQNKEEYLGKKCICDKMINPVIIFK